jgi:hypothetical protein
VVRAIRIHDPECRLPLVVDLVHPAARIDDLRAVGRDLGIGDLFPIEVVIDGQERVGGDFLGAGQARPDERRGTGDEGEHDSERATHLSYLHENHNAGRCPRARTGLGNSKSPSK